MEKIIPDWVEDLPDDQAQPWLVRRQSQFISIRQRDGGDPDQYHWVLVHEDDIEQFLQDVQTELAKRDEA